MSKIILALGSFVLGVATTFFALFTTQAFTAAQERLAPRSAQNQLTPLAVGSGRGAPTVPPISQHFKDFGVAGTNLAFEVDGSECDGCVFNGPVLRYSGGDFQFTNFSFSGPVRVELTGAARNTLIFLQFMQGLAAGQAPQQATPNTSIMKTATVKEPIRGSFGITN
jgi:hypothetical protein